MTAEEKIIDACGKISDRDDAISVCKRAVAAERDRCAKIADDFNWVLPMYNDVVRNEASDDAAEIVAKQIAAAIRNPT